MKLDLPDPKFALLDERGRPGTAFWRFLEGIWRRTGGNGDLTCLTVPQGVSLSLSAAESAVTINLSGTTLTVALTDDATLTLSAVGSDGVTRSGTVVLT